MSPARQVCPAQRVRAVRGRIVLPLGGLPSAWHRCSHVSRVKACSMDADMSPAVTVHAFTLQSPGRNSSESDRAHEEGRNIKCRPRILQFLFAGSQLPQQDIGAPQQGAGEPQYGAGAPQHGSGQAGSQHLLRRKHLNSPPSRHRRGREHGSQHTGSQHGAGVGQQTGAGAQQVGAGWQQTCAGAQHGSGAGQQGSQRFLKQPNRPASAD